MATTLGANRARHRAPGDQGDESFVYDAFNEAVDRAVLRSTPAIAAPPEHRTPGTDLRRLLPYLMPYRTRWIAMVMVSVASLGATVAIPLMTKAVIDGPVRHQDQHGLWLLGAAATGVGISEAVLWFIRRWLVARATMGVEADIRNDLYARLQILPMSFHGRWQSGQLLSRIMNDLSTIRRFMSFGLVFLLLNTIQIIAVTAILLAMYWPLGVVVAVSILPISATVLHFQRSFTRLSRQAQDQSGRVATHVEESALGLRVVKSFGREDYVFERFNEQATALHDVQVRKVRISAKFWTLLEVIPNITLIVVLGLGAYAAGHGLITMGTLVAFITMMLSLVWPIASLGFLLSMTQESMTAANRIAEIFDAPREIVGGPQADVPRGGRLELIDVGFRFPDTPPDAPWALRHVTVTVEPGETLALVGATGSGKSVLAALLSRLHDVTEGQIRIDDHDIRDLSLLALRQTVATAFEDPTLFSMSVAENLRLGRPEATDEQLAEAIDVAAAQFVYELPFGLDTRIGEQGMSLSGGQRQRLSLARAILAAPKILVLDDTLSALDVHTEAVVEEALSRVLHQVTGVVVAHRASTVLMADKVALLDTADAGATITYVGTHAELLARVPRYRYLLAADDDLDDWAEHDCAWEDDDERNRLTRAQQEREATDEVCDLTDSGRHIFATSEGGCI
jgi:ATP-binding cassette subfamily B protein